MEGDSSLVPLLVSCGGEHRVGLDFCEVEARELKYPSKLYLEQQYSSTYEVLRTS